MTPKTTITTGIMLAIITTSLFATTTISSAFAQEPEIQIPTISDIEIPDIPDHPLPDCEPGAVPLAAIDPNGNVHWSCNPIPGPEPEELDIPVIEVDIALSDDEIPDQHCPPGFEQTGIFASGDFGVQPGGPIVLRSGLICLPTV